MVAPTDVDEVGVDDTVTVAPALPAIVLVPAAARAAMLRCTDDSIACNSVANVMDGGADEELVGTPSEVLGSVSSDSLVGIPEGPASSLASLSVPDIVAGD